MSQYKFTALDYVIFGISIAVSLSIGLFFSLKKQKTTNDYFMAGRSMKSFPIAMSLLASFMSAVSILGLPSEVYFYGIQYWMVILSYFIIMPLVVLVYIPVFHGLKLTSAYEYLEKRFSLPIRLLASVIFIFQTVLYSAVVLFAPALVLDTGRDSNIKRHITHSSFMTVVSNFPLWATILTAGLVATFYTAMGGMKAVISTDVVQGGIMLVGLISIIIIGTVKVGGAAEMFQICQNGSRLNFLNFDPDPRVRLTFWSLFIGNICSTLPIVGVNQTAVQRMLTAKSLKSAKRSAWLMLPLFMTASTVTCFSGLVIYALYRKRDCDPRSAGLITRNDEIMPHFVMDVLGAVHGIPGLFLACVAAATLSTISSNLNAMAAVTMEDFIKRFIFHKKPLTDSKATLLSRGLAGAYGVLIIVLSFGLSYLKSTHLIDAAMSVFGATGGPLLGVFTLGMISRRSNRQGTLIGLLLGITFTWVVCIGGRVSPNPDAEPLFHNFTGGCVNVSLPGNHTTTPPKESNFLFSLSFMWYGFIGFSLTYGFGWVISYIGPWKSLPVDSRLMASWLRKKTIVGSEEDMYHELSKEDQPEVSEFALASLTESESETDAAVLLKTGTQMDESSA
eukprot:m.95500 g.95500  ORF g.95500 m.95500 type:complete len:618 (+) comp36852_c0_seq16:81-1934(+)